MRLILHIFRKDARHLWKEISVTWVLLAWLTWLDCGRSSYLPSSSEGWLNILMPLAWSYLAALCVLQDPVPGERSFWLALPARRSTLLIAKALFATAFIQVPYVLSCATVLLARGFHPLGLLPSLLERQTIVLLAVVIPSLALASVNAKVTHFLILAIAFAGLAMVVSGNGVAAFRNVPWQKIDEPRVGFALLTIALFSIVLLWIQYEDRRTRVSGGLGLAGVILAGALYLWLPVRTSALLQAAVHPMKSEPQLALRLDPAQPLAAPSSGFGNAVQVSIPVEIAGMPAKTGKTVSELDLEIDAGNGTRVKAETGPGTSLTASFTSAEAATEAASLLS